MAQGLAAYLRFIRAVILESEQGTGAAMEPITKPLSELGAFLPEVRQVWFDSSKDLVYLIWNKFAAQNESEVPIH